MNGVFTHSNSTAYAVLFIKKYAQHLPRKVIYMDMDKDKKEEKKEEKTSAPASEQEKQQEDKKNSDPDKKSDGTEGENPAALSASDDDKKDTEKGIDYKAELERVKTQLGQAEHTIEETKRENKELKKKAVQEEEEEGWSKNGIIDREKLVSEIKADVKTEILRDTLLETVTENNDERELIKFHYENSIKHSGSSKEAIKADLEAARILANGRRILRENEELKISNKNREGMGKGDTGPNQDKKQQPVISDEDRRIADRMFGGNVERYLKYKQNQK